MLVLRCVSCSLWVSPPQPGCPECDGELAAAPVSGRGEVFTYTVNHHAFDPSLPHPYVIAIIQLEEQSHLRVVANIVGCLPDSVRIGMPVTVTGDAVPPVFVPT